MSNNIKYALQFWKNFSKNLILGLSFLMLLFGIIASQGNLLERGMNYVTAQEVGEIEPIEESYEPYVGEITEEPAYNPYTYSNEPAPEVGNITQYESPSYQEPTYSYSEPQVGNITEIYTEGPGCNGTHAVWGKWSGSSLVSVEADYGETGECGYSGSSSSSSSSSGSQGYDPYAGSSSTQSYSSSNSGSYEGPGCDGANSVWGEWSSDGRLLRVEANYGAQAGECNNPVSGSTNYGSTTSYGSSSSGTWEFKYPQCRGNQVVDVYQHTGTGAYEERNPHYQEDACGYNQTWEGPGCQGNRSVWGIWGGADRSRLISVEKDYGVKPGECNNPYTTSTTYSPTPTYSQSVTYEDRVECDGSEQVTRRYFTNGQKQIISRYGRMAGYCGVGYQTGYTPVYNTTPYQGTGGYYAPYPVATGTYTVPSGVSVPVTTIQNNLVPMQISCSAVIRIG